MVYRYFIYAIRIINVTRKQLYWASIFYCTGIILPLQASALGLGNILVLSPSGMPFSANIPVVSNNSGTLASFAAHLVSPEKFKKYGFNGDNIPAHWKIAVQHGEHPSIQISSTVPLSSSTPFLLKVVWNGGSLIREYTANSGAVSKAEHSAARVPTTLAGNASQTSYYGWSSVIRYGPVPSGSTVAQIIEDINSNPHLNVTQAINAIVQGNPSAFRKGNPSFIYSGAMLNLPSLKKIESEPLYLNAPTYLPSTSQIALKHTIIPVKSVTPITHKARVNKSIKPAGQATHLVLSSSAILPFTNSVGNKIIPARNNSAIFNTFKAQNKNLTNSINTLNKKIDGINAKLNANAVSIQSVQATIKQKSDNSLALFSIGGNAMLLLLMLYLLKRHKKLTKAQVKNLEQLSIAIASIEKNEDQATQKLVPTEQSGTGYAYDLSSQSVKDNISSIMADFESLNVAIHSKTNVVQNTGDTHEFKEEPLYADDASVESTPRVEHTIQTNGAGNIGFLDLADDVIDKPKVGTVEPQTSENSASWDMFGTKLDLARAYIEMGDADSAKGMLHELLEDSRCSQEHIASAQKNVRIN